MRVRDENELIVQASLIAKKLGFNESEAKILVLLLLSDKPLSQREIQERLEYSPAIVSKAINRLVTEGLVLYKKRVGKEKEYYTEVGFIDIFSLIIERIIRRDIEPTMRIIERYLEADGSGNARLRKVWEEYKQSEKYSQIIKKILRADDDTLHQIDAILLEREKR